MSPAGCAGPGAPRRIDVDSGADAIVPWFLLTAGILALVALVLIWRTVAFHRRAVDTTGTVVANESSHSSDGGTTYHAVVQFLVDGQVVQFTDRMGTSPPRYEVGEVIPVKYDPRKPTKAKPGGAFRAAFAPALLLVLAAVFGGIALVFA
ncbi:hypothetical protein B7486_53155 [cyanobacterium TDX16]|nr:hypothetical protein B7486_53155 [cyanobacterium TDX16]